MATDIVQLTEPQRAFIREHPFPAVVTTLRPSGRAETTTEGAREHLDKLARKYLGKDVYPWHQPGEQRIIVRVKPDEVDSYGV